VSSGIPFFAPDDPVVMDAVAVFAALDTDFLAGMAKAVCPADRPVVPAPKKMHNKAAHTTG
jgi:hypothetical protein